MDQSFSKKYYREVLTKQSAKNFSTELLCYDGDPPIPKWYEENIGMFSSLFAFPSNKLNFWKHRLTHIEQIREVCILKADLSELCNESTLVQSQVALGPLKFETMRSYWRVEFEIDLKFGTTALEAAVTWDMNVSSICFAHSTNLQRTSRCRGNENRKSDCFLLSLVVWLIMSLQWARRDHLHLTQHVDKFVYICHIPHLERSRTTILVPTFMYTYICIGVCRHTPVCNCRLKHYCCKKFTARKELLWASQSLSCNPMGLLHKAPTQ